MAEHRSTHKVVWDQFLTEDYSKHGGRICTDTGAEEQEVHFGRGQQDVSDCKVECVFILVHTSSDNDGLSVAKWMASLVVMDKHTVLTS